MLLSDLPPELILLITEHLNQEDVLSLIQTNQSFYTLCHDELYRSNIRMRGGEHLIRAAAQGQLWLVQRFLDCGADPATKVMKMKDVGRFPPWLYPANCDWDWRENLVVVDGAETAKAVIPMNDFYKERYDIQPRWQITVLEEALLNEHKKIAKLILDADTVTHTINDVDRERARWLAERQGFRDKRFRTCLPKLFTGKTRDLYKRICWAIKDVKNVSISELERLTEDPLLDPNWRYPNWDGPTLFHIAVHLGCTEMAASLLDRGIRDIKSTVNDYSPFIDAFHRYDQDMLDLLLDQPNVYVLSNDLLYRAWDPPRMRVLLDGVLGGRVRFEKPSSKFYWAVEKGSKIIMQILLAHPGIKIDRLDWDNKSWPLSHAISKGNLDIIKVLFAHSPKAVLPHALASDSLDVLKLVLCHSPENVNNRDRYGLMPIMRAIANGHQSIFEFLLGHSFIDLDARDIEGATPLAMAAYHGRASMLSSLLATGRVDVNSRDNYGNTPLCYAAMKAHRAEVNLLLAYHGTQKHPVNNTGKTPACLALDAGDKELSKFLQGWAL